MDTVRLESPGALCRVATADPPEPGPGEALVRVHRVGICGTDYHAFHGRQPFVRYPLVLGHELGVEVVAVGAGVDHVAPGDRCAVLPYLECGRCIACRRGRPNCCTDLQVLGVHVDGGLRERMLVPAAKLFAREGLSFDQLALCETLGIGAHAVARGGVAAGDGVVVVGLGPIGLGAAQAARARGARVLGVDVDAGRRAAARERFGAALFGEGDVIDATVIEGGPTLADRLAERLGGELPVVVIDATGHPASMDAATALAAPSGSVVFVGLHPQTVSFPDPLFHRRELTLCASRNATDAEFRAVLDGMASGAIDTSVWITHRTDLGAVVDDLPRFGDRAAGVLKAMVDLS